MKEINARPVARETEISQRLYIALPQGGLPSKAKSLVAACRLHCAGVQCLDDPPCDALSR